jgi:hypothetical protein
MIALLAPLLDAPWVVPAIGLTAAGIALALGLLFLAARRGRRPANLPPASLPPPDLSPPAPPLSGARVERRTAPRRKGNCVEVDVTADAGRPPLYGWVEDRSVGGLCLLLDRPMAEGEALLVRPRTGGEPLPWCPVTVRTCQSAGTGRWAVGVKFERTPSWNLMQLFG